MFLSYGVRCEVLANVSQDSLGVHERGCPHDRFDKVCRPEGRCQLMLQEDWSEILGVDGGIFTHPLLKVDVPTSSKGIRLCTKSTRPKPYDKVKL